MEPDLISAATAYVDKELEELFGSDASTFFDGQIMTARYSVDLHDEDEAVDDTAGGWENQEAAVETAIQGSTGDRKSLEDAGDQADERGQANDAAGTAATADEDKNAQTGDEDKNAETGDETSAVPADPIEKVVDGPDPQQPNQSHETDPDKPMQTSTIVN